MSTTENTIPTKREYYPQLDTLRMIAAFIVINYHWLSTGYPALFGLENYSFWKFGYYGVQLFFVLSGFLIANILLQKKEKANEKTSKTIKNFYIRRSLRLFPVYYLFIIFLVVIKNPFVSENFWWFATYTANIGFYVSGGMVDAWSNHLWTLSIEEQFYLVFPFLMLLTPRKLEFLIPILAILVALPLRLYYQPTDESFYILTFAQIDTLGAGVLLALIKNHYPKHYLQLSNNLWKSVMLFFLTAAILIFFFVPKESVLRYGLDISILISFTLLVANTAMGFKGIVGRIFENSFLKHLGQISYGLYLYHKIIPLLLILVLNKLGWSINNVFLYYGVNLVILYIVTTLSWKILEMPLMRLKNRFK